MIMHGEHGAGLHRLAVEVDGTGAALARVAAHVRTGQTGQLADEVDEEQPWLDLVGVLDAVDGDAHGRFHRAYLLGSLDGSMNAASSSRGRGNLTATKHKSSQAPISR